VLMIRLTFDRVAPELSFRACPTDSRRAGRGICFLVLPFGLRRLDTALPSRTTLCTIVIPNPACPDEGWVAFFANGGEGSAFARLECGGSTPLCSAARVRTGAACCAHRHAVATALEMKP
jgi:hypothetical protein